MGDTGSLFCLYNPRHLHTWSATSETVPSNNKTVNAGHCGIPPPQSAVSSWTTLKRRPMQERPSQQATLTWFTRDSVNRSSVSFPPLPDSPQKRKNKKNQKKLEDDCKNPETPRRSSSAIECFRLSSFPLWPPKMEFLKDPFFFFGILQNHQKSLKHRRNEIQKSKPHEKSSCRGRLWLHG